MAKKILVPLPSRDFDPSEAAISWRYLTDHGLNIVFATPDGKPSEGDPLMLTGQGLDFWGKIPGLQKLPLVGLMLRARKDARGAYRQMKSSAEFSNPIAWQKIQVSDYDGLLLPGGHWARGMREYLESSELQQVVAEFFRLDKPVAAICHGVLLAARSKDGVTGRSVLYGRKTTGLTWALEKSAASITRFTRYWDPNYYRTYPELPGQPFGYQSTQQEVSRLLASTSDFLDVPKEAPQYWRKTSGLFRDTLSDRRASWVVRDGNYVSARWPGDLYQFCQVFTDLHTLK